MIYVDGKNLLVGVVVSNPNGFGFLSPIDNSGNLYLSPASMKQVFHGDLIVVSAVDGSFKKKRAANFVTVLERRTQTLIGSLIYKNNKVFVRPYNPRFYRLIYVTEKFPGLSPDCIVEISIKTYPDSFDEASGVVTRIIGHLNESNITTKIVSESFNNCTEL